MPAYTNNFNLYKPNRADSEQVDITLSDNFDKIDTEIKNRKNEIEAHANATVAHNSRTITHGEGTVESAFTEVNSRVVTLGVEVNSRIDEVDQRVSSLANEAVNIAIDVQNQFDEVVNRATDTDAMSRQAAIATDGTDFKNLKDRLDAEHRSVSSQLAEIATNIDSFAIQIPEVDDTGRIQRAIDSLPKANPNGTGVGGFIFGSKTYIISKPIIVQNGNVTFGGKNKGGFTIKASDNFVGDALLKWNTGGKWNYITNNSLRDVSFDCNNLRIAGVILESWYDNCNIDNVNVKNFKDNYGFVMQPGSNPNDVTILQGITIKSLEVNPCNVSSAGSALFHALYESSFVNCKFWSTTNIPNTKNDTVDVVTLKRCRGLNIIGGSAASGNNGYVVVGDDTLTARNINFYGVTVENLVNAGIYFKGSATQKVFYCTVNGLRSVTPLGKEVLFDYCVGCKMDVLTDFQKIELTPNADHCMLFGFLSGGAITDNGVNTMQLMYDATTLQFNKQLKLKNGTKIYDDGTRTLILAKGDKFQILNENGSTVLAEISPNQSLFNSLFRLANQTTTTVAPSAGSAGALPSNPVGYMTIMINGVQRLIPYY